MRSYECRYANAFWFFERASNERFAVAKVVNAHLASLFRNLEDYVLLDIGAGFGGLGGLINGHFRSRVAIDPNPFCQRRLSARYDVVSAKKYEPECHAIEGRTIVLMSQSLYFYSTVERARLLSKLISNLGEQSVLFLILDTFSGPFGHFLRRWLYRFGLNDQLILPTEINRILGRMAARYTFEEISSTIRCKNFFSFSRAMSVYFDVVEPVWRMSDKAYLDELRGFKMRNCFQTENMLGVWAIKRGCGHE